MERNLKLILMYPIICVVTTEEMRRDEAVTCLKEIITNIKDLDASAITLADSKPNDKYVVGLSVHINLSFDRAVKDGIEYIARKHGLSIREEKDELIIYQPKNLAMCFKACFAL